MDEKTILMKKTILFAIPNLNGGGAERVTVNFIRNLNPNLYNIRLLLIQKAGPLLDLIPNYVTIVSLNKTKTRQGYLALIKAVNNIKPNIIFTTTNRMNILVLAASFFFKKGIKIFIREPNMPKAQIVNGELSTLSKWTYLLMIRLFYPRADKVIAQTEEMADEINQIFKIDNHKIITIHNPIDKAIIDEKIKNATNPFDSNYINVVAAGRIVKQKGFDILIRGFKQVVEQNDKFRLFIIGNDRIGERKALEAQIEKLGLKNYIRFLGFQNNPYKYYYYSDLFVLSSRWEGLPNTVLENLYLKKPIVATKCIPYMNKLIRNGKNGFLVDIESPEQLANSILKFKQLNPHNNNKENIIIEDYVDFR